MRLPLKLAALTVAAVLGLSGCGGDDDDAATATTAAGERNETGSTVPAGTKVSANDATEDEIAAALEAAGVPNASKWADEVVEYRPYPKDDATFAKLRDELAKYNPGEGVVDKIVSVLEP